MVKQNTYRKKTMCAILVEQDDCVIGFYSVRYATTSSTSVSVDTLEYSTTLPGKDESIL